MTPEQLHKHLRDRGISPFEYALELSQRDEWQNISTVPKDGTEVLMAFKIDGKSFRYSTASFSGDVLYDWSWNSKPTHWKLISPPKGEV